MRGTLQLGQPAWIAEATGISVVSDLRARDVAAGGQGAPLVSIIDVLWLRGRSGVPIALNLGGIANITVVHGEPVAFDTGPANALIDAVVTELTGRAFDADGVMAARGRVNEELLGRLLAEPYYGRPAPKSTGKELFNLAYLARALEGLPDIPADDLVATVTTLTARTVGDAVRRYGGTEVIASGGGIRNPVLMHLLGVGGRRPGADHGRARAPVGGEGGVRVRRTGFPDGPRARRDGAELHGRAAFERARVGHSRAAVACRLFRATCGLRCGSWWGDRTLGL